MKDLEEIEKILLKYITSFVKTNPKYILNPRSSYFCLREEKPYLFLDAVAILPQTARGFTVR